MMLPYSVQFVKEYPLLGLAVTVQELPLAKLPPPLVVPPLVGLDEVDTVYWIWAKLATRVRLLETVKV